MNKQTTESKNMTLKDRMTVAMLLHKQLKRLGSSDKYAYSDGWNDARVAKEIGKGNSLSVARIRKQVFGPLGEYHFTKKPTGRPSNQNRLTKLELRVGKLEQTIEMLLSRSK